MSFAMVPSRHLAVEQGRRHLARESSGLIYVRDHVAAIIDEEMNDVPGINADPWSMNSFRSGKTRPRQFA